jgi:hypothetical protein
MPIVAGGRINPPTTAGVTNPGIRAGNVYAVEAVPTDANVGLQAGELANGMFAQNVLTGFLYERQAGAWVRIDTV